MHLYLAELVKIALMTVQTIEMTAALGDKASFNGAQTNGNLARTK